VRICNFLKLARIILFLNKKKKNYLSPFLAYMCRNVGS
jgi:hypothetical protein